MKTKKIYRKTLGCQMNEYNTNKIADLLESKSYEKIEFIDDKIEKIKKKIANKHGYELIDHRLELYCKKK